MVKLIKNAKIISFHLFKEVYFLTKIPKLNIYKKSKR